MKLQIWSMDLIFAVVIFSFTITVVGIIWLHISNGLATSYGNSQGVMFMQAGAMSDVLLSAGTPADWQSVISATNSLTWSGVAPGIETTAGQPQISLTKLYALMSMAAANYTATKALFGIGNDYYIVITSPGPGIGNITIGRNPLTANASTVFVDRRSAVLDGSPVWVQIMVWSGGTPGTASVISSSSNPVTGALAFVPVTVINSNTIAGTGSNFQQMVYFNPTQSSAYTTNEAYDLGNVRFYQGPTELHSWCESGCNSITSTNAVFWVNLPGGIAASSSVSINMTFLSNMIEYDGQYAGECPTCNSVYAKYDNGAKVFQFYDDFAGGSLNTNLWTSLSTGYTVSNQLQITGVCTGAGTNSCLVSLSTFGTGVVADMYREATVENWFGFDIPGTYAAGGVLFYDQSGWDMFNNAAAYPAGSESANTWYVQSGAVTASKQAIEYVNYVSITSSPTSYFTNSNGNLYVGANGGTGYVDWIRLRSYPPGGVMPSVNLGTMYS